MRIGELAGLAGMSRTRRLVELGLTFDHETDPESLPTAGTSPAQTRRLRLMFATWRQVSP